VIAWGVLLTLHVGAEMVDVWPRPPHWLPYAAACGVVRTVHSRRYGGEVDVAAEY
jgi:hypothetical protein